MSPFAFTRNLSPEIFLLMFIVITGLFVMLVLMIFRFDLAGGDKGDQERINKPLQKPIKLADNKLINISTTTPRKDLKT